jgi:glucose dehydrogenase
MKQTLLLLCTLVALGVAVGAQKKSSGVTADMLTTPPPEDWLMYSRTYDAQRYSPLEFVNRRNVSQLKTAWMKELGTGNHEGIPIVFNGVMYLIEPGAAVEALTTRPRTASSSRWTRRRGPCDGRRKPTAA